MTKPNKDIMVDAGRDADDFTVPVFRIEDLTPAVIKDIIVHGNMSGWSVVKGWMTKFVKLMRDNLKAGNCIVMYYADNLSVFCCITTKNGPVWRGWSIDGEKMEGQHTASDVKKFHRMIVNLFSKDIDSNFSKVALGVMDEQLIGTKWYWDNYLVDGIGLPSGYAGTSHINTYKMSNYV